MAAGVKPPAGEIAIVFTDVVKAGALWEFNAEAMKDATILHNDTLRGLLAQYKGYEVVSNREGNTGGMSTGGEGSLCIVFQDVTKALEWCMTAQQQLLEVEWPLALLAHPAAAEEWGDTDDRLIFKVCIAHSMRHSFVQHALISTLHIIIRVFECAWECTWVSLVVS